MRERRTAATSSGGQKRFTGICEGSSQGADAVDILFAAAIAPSHIVNDLADFMNAQAFHVWCARHIVFLDQD